MNRILFFVHYNKYNIVSNYIFYLLKNIKENFNRVIFISNSFLDTNNYKLINEFCDKIIIRKNIGFDFGAWKDAILEEGWDNVTNYNSITLMNDSCFGPLFGLKEIYEKMEKPAIDFWGLTNHKKIKNRLLQPNRFIPEHIQSYFICFNKKVVKSMIFRKFWTNLRYFDDIKKVIKFYKTQLTFILSRTGFRYSVYFDTKNINNIKHNDIATWYPDLILKNNVPLIKIKSFIHFPVPGYIINCLNTATQYPTSLITEYFDKMYEPNINLLLYDKSIMIGSKTEVKNYTSLKIAIHLHVYYIDMLQDFITYFSSFEFAYDIYITTNSIEKKEKIYNSIINSLSNSQLREVFVFENKGRDVLPWLNLSDRLNKYDIVGHFHTKKTNHAEEWFGAIWYQELLDHLLLPINLILNTFMDNKNIGVIIPEIPVPFHIKPEKNLDETSNHKILNELWKKMKCEKSVSFDRLLTVIMPYGNMFWYRPDALKQLFDLNLSSSDFPDEPLPNDGTVTHCIERLIAYIAWNNNYDFRIIVSNTSYNNCFYDNMIYNNAIKEIKQLKTYRIGDFILFVPRRLKIFLMKSNKILKKCKSQ
jgi:rhamnosyltransferase